jgi:hypothetical protein
MYPMILVAGFAVFLQAPLVVEALRHRPRLALR